MTLEDVGALLARLRENANRQITAMAVEFVAPDQPSTLPAKSGESSAVITGASAEPISAAATAAQADPPAATGKVRRSSQRGALLRNIGARVAGIGAKGVDLLLHLLDRLIPAPPDGKKGWLSSPFAAGLTLLIPVVVVVLVVMFWISGTGESEFDQCVSRATETVNTARGIASSDTSGHAGGVEWRAGRRRRMRLNSRQRRGDYCLPAPKPAPSSTACRPSRGAT